MILKSKFAGWCTTCGKNYASGTDIEWTKEHGARHLNCMPPEEPQKDAEALAERLGFTAKKQEKS